MQEDSEDIAHRSQEAVPSPEYVEAPPREQRIVLFAIPVQTRPTTSVLWARALARALRAKLHVLCVAAKKSGPHGARTTAELAEVLPGLDEALLEAEPIDHLSLVHGDYFERTAAYAGEIDADLIVLPAGDARMGHLVSALALRTRTPVLLARHTLAHHNILAATDLESAGYPVLRTAAELASGLDAKLIAVHNVAPVAVTLANGSPWPFAALSDDPALTFSAHRLLQASRQLAVPALPLVSNYRDAVRAIVSEARTRQVDLVVVGVRPHGWLHHLLERDVAARVVEEWQRSVLVTPIAELEPAGEGVPVRA